MLNKNNERELAYLVRVENITPMNADRLECAHIGGWHCVVGKGEFKVGDPAVYFEIDSQLPDVEPFSSMEFLKSKNFKIKSQKIRGEISQGLLMPLSAWIDKEGKVPTWLAALNVTITTNGLEVVLESEAKFLTRALGVTYAEPGDNVRKAPSMDKYKSMGARHQRLFKLKPIRWLMRRNWGRKLLFFFFGKKRDKKSDWPYWVVKTDEERAQNCPWLYADPNKFWYVTEKIDGTSTTFTMKGYGLKRKFFVCSRNVVFNKPDKKCFYDVNVYTEMAEKYSMEIKMAQMMNDHKNVFGKPLDYITIQAETYGNGIQKRTYGLAEHDMAIFNIIFGFKDGTHIRLNPAQGERTASHYHLPYVPVIGLREIPTNCDELITYATGNSMIDGMPREGYVFRSEDGIQSFKAVSNEYLLKYHG